MCSIGTRGSVVFDFDFICGVQPRISYEAPKGLRLKKNLMILIF
jgi:hypothetical protein